MNSYAKPKRTLESIHDDFLVHGMKVIPIDYNDMNKNINPYDFYFCVPPEEATSDIKKVLSVAHLGSYYAGKIGHDSNIVVLRIIENNGGNESLKEYESKYGTLPKTAIVKTPIGYDYFFKCDPEWLRTQVSSMQSEFFEYTGHANPKLLDNYIKEMVLERPYYRGHELKQKNISRGINLILDGYIIIPPSQWYTWHTHISMSDLPMVPPLIVRD